MSEININKPTEYSLIDNNKKYLPSRFVFVPTICLTSNSETIKNAIAEQKYYNVENDDFVCKITHKTPSEPSSHIVCETDEENVYVCKYTKSDEGIEYVACSSKNLELDDVLDCQSFDATNVMVKILHDGQNVALSYFYDTSNGKSLKHIQTDNNHKSYIQIPSDYDSLEINSSNVYFRKENNNDEPSWVNISGNVENRKVSFKNIQISSKPDITVCFQDSSMTITKNNTVYSLNTTFIEPLENAKEELENAKEKLENAKEELEKEEANLNSVKNDLTSAKDLLKEILYVEDTHSPSFDSLVTLATRCKSFYKEITNADKLPEPIQTLGNPNSKVSEIFSNFEDAENKILSEPIEQENLQNAKNLLMQVINTLNTLPTAESPLTYLTDNNNNNLVGLKDNQQSFFIEWLDKLLIYCQNNMPNNMFNFNFLDVKQKMIIPQTSSDSNNIYDLVYLENYNQNGDRILPDDDYFITTVVSTEP